MHFQNNFENVCKAHKMVTYDVDDVEECTMIQDADAAS